MPAGLPGSTLVENQGNPSAGAFVIMDPLSGPAGSPLDARTIIGWDSATRMPIRVNDPENISTGALSTGIGFSCANSIRVAADTLPATSPGAISQAGFNDNQVPGEQLAAYSSGPPPVVSTNTIASEMMYIGGGRCDATSDGIAAVDPYTDGVAIVGAGNSQVRDSATATGYPLKMVTATGSVSNGSAVETGFENRTGATIASGTSVFGSSTTELSAAATLPSLSAATDGTPTSDGATDAGVTTDIGNGTLFWVVVTNGGAATNAEIVAGAGGDIVAGIAGYQAITATGAQAFDITGLTAATDYEIIMLQITEDVVYSAQAEVALTTTA